MQNWWDLRYRGKLESPELCVICNKNEMRISIKRLEVSKIERIEIFMLKVYSQWVWNKKIILRLTQEKQLPCFVLIRAKSIGWRSDNVKR